MNSNELPKTQSYIPGYTGHIPHLLPEQYIPTGQGPEYHIPGYGGFVQSIKAENVFAAPFGQITKKCRSKDIPIGFDYPPQVKYVSMHTQQFIKPTQMNYTKVSDFVGVHSPKPVIDKVL